MRLLRPLNQANPLLGFITSACLFGYHLRANHYPWDSFDRADDKCHDRNRRCISFTRIS